METIDPVRTAAVIIDIQNDLFEQTGFMARNGYDIAPHAKIIPALKALVSTVRTHGIRLIYTQMAFRPDLADAPARYLEIRPIITKGGLRRGTWGANIIDAVRPRSKDYVIVKTRYSAFYGTDLEVLLRGLRVDTLVFAGVGTDGCVDSTLRDAFYRDYRIILISDCTATWEEDLKEATLRTVRYAFGDVISLRDFKKMLRDGQDITAGKSS